MSNIEDQIRTLPIQAPSRGLDERVLSVLNSAQDGRQTGTDRTVFRESADAGRMNNPTSGLTDADQQATRRNGTRRGLASTAGPVAAVALIIGIAVGQFLPMELALIRSRNPVSTAVTAATGDSTDSPVATETERNSTGSDAGEAVGHPWLTPQSAVTVAAEMAFQWEIRTGQQFDVKRHVSDRRFDGCRECHRSGG